MIGISGFGFVGSALYSAISDKSQVMIYDPKIVDYNNMSQLLLTDIVFICAPTPLVDGQLDASAVIKNLKYLDDNNYFGLVVIKSTIHPSAIDEMYKTNLNLISNPEFLNEHTAVEDFKNQSQIIIGGRFDLCELLKNQYLNEFDMNRGANYTCVSFEEALIFKYVRNIKIAYEVMFWEFVNDTTGNYRKYNKMLEKLPIKVTNIGTDGERGFGGHCLPKDTASYPSHRLTDYLLTYNNVIRK